MVTSLELRHITKRFPSVVANNDISLSVSGGQVHALLGENGAGKSTLMNIVYGLYQPDEGDILVDGRPVRFAGPRDAIAHHIGMVHQHFMLVPPLTVAENVMLGAEETAHCLLAADRVAARIRELSARYGLDVDPLARVRDLSVGQQQRVEIIKALYRGADILILDEPTAVLTPAEAAELLTIMRGLAEQGRALIFITHKLHEVLAVADHITVLRGGSVAGTAEPAATTAADLAALMVGRPVLLRIEKVPAQPGAVMLEARDVHAAGDRGLPAVDGVSLSVRAGEVLGIAGVEGNGQSELVEALTGLRRVRSGMVRVNGHDLTHASPRAFTEAGVAHIPADRHRFGLVLSQPVDENLVLSTYYRPPYARGLVRNFAAVLAHARRLIPQFDIRTPSPAVAAGALSGGNQQKVVAARELSRDNRLLIAAQPTRGLDIGSIEFIHSRIIAARDAGMAVLLVSAELDEILSLSDRVAVMYKGRVVAEMDATGADPAHIGMLMAGGA